MKILLVNDVPVNAGHGTENHVRTLSEAFRAHGHKTFILAGQLRGEHFFGTDDCRLIPDLAAPLIRKRQVRHMKNIRIALDRMRKFVAEVQPDVIHVHNMLNPFTLEALREMGPVVKSIHDCRPFCSKPPVNVASRLVGNSSSLCDRTFGPGCWRRCYLSLSPKDFVEASGFFIHNLMALRQVMQCGKIIVYSDYLRRLAQQAGCDPAKLELIHLFIDYPAIDPEEVQFPVRRKVLYIGRLSHEKGVMHLLEAIRRIPEPFETVIIGEGPLEREVRDTAAGIPGKKITVTGYMPHDQLVTQYRQASLVVFPSIGSEGCGLVGIEALAHGKPVVAFDAGGVPEWLIDGETGCLAHRADIRQLAEKIRRLVKDTATARRMGETGIDLVNRKFRKDLHIGRILAVYADAMMQAGTHRVAMTGSMQSLGKA